MKKLRDSNSLRLSHSRWLAYATASAATLAAGNQVAEAAIHYSGMVDVRLAGKAYKQATFQLDQRGDSILFNHTYFSYAGFNIVGLKSAQFQGFDGIDLQYAFRLRRDKYVSQGQFTHGYGRNTFVTLAGGFGSFSEPGIGYIGFKFNGGNGTQYGWARVRGEGPDRRNAITVLDYAYADPGEAIRTGQTSSDEFVPSLGSLGLLGLGAAGLAAWRRGGKR